MGFEPDTSRLEFTYLAYQTIYPNKLKNLGMTKIERMSVIISEFFCGSPDFFGYPQKTLEFLQQNFDTPRYFFYVN